MDTQALHKFVERITDWKYLIGLGIIILTTLFNLGSSLFNYALISKLAPINAKVSAIEEAGKQRDETFDDFKSNYDRQYGGLVDKIDNVSNKIDRLTYKLIK